MELQFLVNLLFVIVGLLVYLRKPKSFFFYCMSIQPYFMPFIYLPLQSLTDTDTIISINVGFMRSLSILMLILSIISLMKNKELLKNFKELLLPYLLLIFFLIYQNFSVGFHFGALSQNVKEASYIIAPFLLIMADKRVTPDRNTFILFIEWFVGIQLFFCFLNLLGFRWYGKIHGDAFDDSLICGTFTRYNHMANYLATFFLVLSNEFFKNNGITKEKYIVLSFFIVVMIVISGSRMTTVLIAFVVFYHLVIYKRHNLLTIACVMIFVYAGWKGIMGNQNYLGIDSNDGEGIERTVSGIVNVANSDDLSEGSTLFLTAILLDSFFESPIKGNGRALRQSDFYYISKEANEDLFPTDARLVFMLVEYGVVGFSLFMFLFYSIMKCSCVYGSENDKLFYIGAFLFFLLFTVTDDGFFDKMQFLIVTVYAFLLNVPPKEDSLCENVKRLECYE